MKNILYLLGAMLLATMVMAACGGAPDPTASPKPPTPTPTATATPEPPTPTPTATATPVPAPEPTESSTPEPDVTEDGGLSLDCPADGSLTSAIAVTSCSVLAAGRVKSFSFDATADLLALFPIGGAASDEGSIKLTGTIVPPDRLRYTITLGPVADMIEISGITIGADTYFQEPESGVWLKGTVPDEDLLSSLQMVGMLMLPIDSNAFMDTTLSLNEDSMVYIIISDQPLQEGESGFLPLQSTIVTRSVGIDDFLTREVRVSSMGLDGETRDFMTISYHSYNEPAIVEPPASYIPLPDDAMRSGPMEDIVIKGLTRNADGDVEVAFSGPVFVEGGVELYVLNPETGGWGLPLVSGSGTNTLTFDADSPDRPPLVAGESQIAGFSFPEFEYDLVGSDGRNINPYFEIWTYE